MLMWGHRGTLSSSITAAVHRSAERRVGSICFYWRSRPVVQMWRLAFLQVEVWPLQLNTSEFGLWVEYKNISDVCDWCSERLANTSSSKGLFFVWEKAWGGSAPPSSSLSCRSALAFMYLLWMKWQSDWLKAKQSWVWLISGAAWCSAASLGSVLQCLPTGERDERWFHTL